MTTKELSMAISTVSMGSLCHLRQFSTPCHFSHRTASRRPPSAGNANMLGGFATFKNWFISALTM